MDEANSEKKKQKHCVLCADPARDNKGRFCAKCLMRVRRYKQKAAAVAYKNNKCGRCGISGNQEIFDFHHHRDKKDTVSNLIANNRKWSIILEELDKCEMLCCMCHKESHRLEKIDNSKLRFDKIVSYSDKKTTRLTHKHCIACKIKHNFKRKLCRKCHTNGRRNMIKEKAVRYAGGKCIRCGWIGHHEHFDFHHRSQKDFGISSKMCLSWEKLKNEINKCDLLCAMCHRLEHASTKNAQFLAEVERYRNTCITGTAGIEPASEN